MNATEPVILSRDCEAVQIPNGERVLLRKGSHARITQSLGGTYTVITEEGFMARIAAKDADAIGKKAEIESSVGGTHASSLQQDPVDQAQLEKYVWAQLRSVYDPEIPVNVVDLGLIYLCEVKPLPEDPKQFEVHVKMTLTAPGCGMGSVLQADAQGKILRLPGVKRANVEMVIDPPWNPGKMTEAAKLQLGM